MDSRLRRVRKLRLRSRDESLNRHGAMLIEDALRTASFPDEGSARLLLVRSLAIRIAADSSPSTVAMRLEAKVCELGSVAVYADLPSAAAAPAVYFHDQLDAHIAMALKLARDEKLDAWFWRLVVPGFTPAMSRDEALRIVLTTVMASGTGPAAVLALVRRLVHDAAIDPLLESLRHNDGPALMRAFGWTLAPAPVSTTEAQPLPAENPSPEIARIAVLWLTRWGPGDARMSWLACVLQSIARPYLLTHPDLPAKAMAWAVATLSQPPTGRITTASADASLNSGDPPARRPALRFDDDVVVSPSQTLYSSQGKDAQPNTGLENRPGAGSEPVVRAEVERERFRDNSDSRVLPDRAVAGDYPVEDESSPRATHPFTARAGLFFLVPILDRLGIGQWLIEHPATLAGHIPALILQNVVERLGTSTADPIVTALNDLHGLQPDGIRECRIDATVSQWVGRVRHYARRTARIGMRSLVCRPGRIVFTQTHLDVIFRLDSADIRIRRAGFDLDPGWTPWMGRVIRFHYLAGGDYDG